MRFDYARSPHRTSTIALDIIDDLEDDASAYQLSATATLPRQVSLQTSFPGLVFYELLTGKQAFKRRANL